MPRGRTTEKTVPRSLIGKSTDYLSGDDLKNRLIDAFDDRPFPSLEKAIAILRNIKFYRAEYVEVQGERRWIGETCYAFIIPCDKRGRAAYDTECGFITLGLFRDPDPKWRKGGYVAYFIANGDGVANLSNFGDPLAASLKTMVGINQRNAERPLTPEEVALLDSLRPTYLAKVYVTLKPTVNDPQGLTIKQGLEMLGFATVRSVRAGKYMEIRVDEAGRAAAEAQVQEMCRKLLANPIIEDFRFELVEQAE